MGGLVRSCLVTWLAGTWQLLETSAEQRNNDGRTTGRSCHHRCVPFTAGPIQPDLAMEIPYLHDRRVELRPRERKGQEGAVSSICNLQERTRLKLGCPAASVF